ncbi:MULTISPECIES: dihydroorotase [Marichromatium]|uniref:Dihydroorotase n=1 Tax=Marichromatium gracile TaxID=1048 RepID=A0A4R4AFW7_MARGR|nr:MULTISPECIES: dihydroorotase [Marichromatium]MBK1710152.1 dihydroorotase [Marichromatium gracile]RNE89135.1 dihydroorotase [Marichromatium sp. AB31]RNE92400.1 dihydroorotase [Marichromatium sp. AB32]TCW38122.1 dihydroorotase [Marichromatium gracile]
MTETIEITRPDDWHLHLRDGAAMADVVGHSARQFARAIIMPNLKPPVTDTALALAYRERILAALPQGSGFEPLMTLYLTDLTRPEEIDRARASGAVAACKLYPAGATTNSDSGVTDIARIAPVLEAMQRNAMPLLVHCEVTDPEVDIFEREQRFIDDKLVPLLRDFPELKVVFEHVTTADGVALVREGPETLGATITPHHLRYNRNALLAGGIRPHFYCLPVLKHERHREALVEAATSGHPRFFLGTDSAPHPRTAKLSDCGCAGAYSAHAALELYAEVFDEAGALDRLEGFASHHGADFYGLPRNQERVRLTRTPWQVPAHYPFGEDCVVPLRAGETLGWRLETA